MSGGYFDYNQYMCGNIADKIQYLINTKDSKEKDQWGEDIGHHFSSDIIQNFKETISVLKTAEAMVQRVDWLLPGDDGEDSFRERWKEEVADKTSLFKPFF